MPNAFLDSTWISIFYFFQIISNEFLLKQLAEQITHKQQCPIEIFIYYTKQIKIEMQSKTKQNKTKQNKNKHLFQIKTV